MLRTHLTRLAVAVGLVAMATQASLANFYYDVQYASGGDAGSSLYSVNVQSPSDVVTLNVYALITDATPDPNKDIYKNSAGGFLVASPTLKGDVNWASWNATNVATGVATKGTQALTSYGALGLGGTASTVTTSTAWFNPPASTGTSFLTGGSLYTPPAGGSPVGVEYLMGTITVSFSAYALPAVTTTAPLGVLGVVKESIGTKMYNFADSAGTYSGVFGSVSNIGNNPSTGSGTANTDLAFHGGGAGLNFVFTSSNTGGNNSAALSANVAVSGPTTILGGGTTALAGNVTNSGSAPANALNWGSSAPGTVTLVPSSSNGVAQGASNALTGGVSATLTQFGPWKTPVTFTGTDASTLAVLPSVSSTLSFNIIGKGSKPTGDGLGIPGGPYGNLMSTQGSAAAGYNLAGLTTTLGTGASSFGIGQTTATILAGQLSTSSTGISETWRSRSSNETPAGSKAAGGAPAFLPLYGDVVSLTGISGGSSTVYALQMTYDPNELGGTASAAAAASGGFLFLGYRSADGVWKNAASTGGTTNDGNTGPPGPNAVSNFQGSFAAFTTANNFSLSNLLGSWGVDTANDTVWGVINHDAEFAPVPEPGTIALLVGGIAALGFAYRRRKAVKA